jgi:amino acid permease
MSAMDIKDEKKSPAPSVENNDVEKHHIGYEKGDVVPGTGNLKRQLKNRHIAMISIGGVYVFNLFLLIISDTASGLVLVSSLVLPHPFEMGDPSVCS